MVCQGSVYSEDEIALVRSGEVPRHVAVIMDGNRRWAKRHNLPAVAGHWKGAEAITQVVKAAAELGIRVLTVFAFSTENWARPQEEIDAIMELFKIYLLEQKEEMQKQGVRLGTIGDISRFSESLKLTLEETKQATAQGNKIDLVLALNYGGRDDIRRATLAILEDVAAGTLRKEELSEQLFASYLDTAAWGDPQFLIRTSGEQRISNFLLWQVSYSEVYMTQVLWPDFNENDLLDAVLEYQRRERRLGG